MWGIVGKLHPFSKIILTKSMFNIVDVNFHSYISKQRDRYCVMCSYNIKISILKFRKKLFCFKAFWRLLKTNIFNTITSGTLEVI